MKTNLPESAQDNNEDKNILRKNQQWKTLRFYQKTDTLYQLTFSFCKRFLPLYGDRTVDQMVQAARSGKQNIIEGTEDGVTSTEMELKLINVARSSLQELRADYEDYIKSRHLQLWGKNHPRYIPLLNFCRVNNDYAAYKPFIYRWTAEEFCNTAITLLHITDRMMCRYLEHLQKAFIEQGGIKERMYAARTGYRRQQDELIKRLQEENNELKAENERLRNKLLIMKNK